MNEQPDEIDDLMRQRFRDYQKDPPEEVWDNILGGLNRTPAKPAVTGTRRWIALPVAASILLVLTSVFVGIKWYHSDAPLIALKPDTYQVTNRREVSGSIAQQQQTATANLHENENSGTAKHQPTAPFHKPAKNNVQAVSANPSLQLQNSEEAFTLASSRKENQDLTDALQPGHDPYNVGGPPERSDQQIQLMNNKNTIELNINLCNNLTPIYSETATRIVNKQRHARHPEFFLGMNYTPTYQFQENKDDMIHGVALDAGIKYSHLVIQSGAGLEFQHASSNSIMTYLADETLSTGIHDTLFHKEKIMTRTRYTYVNVPLLLGYEWYKRNWALSLNAGGVYTFLINQQLKEVKPDHENVLEVKIYDRTPIRKTQWLSVVLMPKAEYYLNEHISLDAAPWLRYSFQGAHNSERMNAMNPIAIGLNAGVSLHF